LSRIREVGGGDSEHGDEYQYVVELFLFPFLVRNQNVKRGLIEE